LDDRFPVSLKPYAFRLTQGFIGRANTFEWYQFLREPGCTN